MLLRCVWRESRRSCFWFSYRGIRMAGIGGTEWTAEMEAEIRAIAEREMPEDMTAEDKKVVREARKKMKEIEKAKKKERKAAAAAAAVNLAESARVDDVEYLDASKEPEQIYGDYKLIQSRCAKTGSGRKFTKVEALDASQIGKQLWIRARLHNVRAVAKNAFLILRQKTSSAQAVLSPSDTIPREMIKWALKNITTESVIDVQGQIVESEVKSCTQNTIEIAVQRLYVVSKAAQPLPFLPDDAARPVHEEGVHVDRKTRLDARIVDLRVQAHQAIFRIQSGVCQLFREFLYGHGFTEIHSPKLIAGASEGGANVFHLEYFKNPACLAQSPQLYKQMAICGDMERVFEVKENHFLRFGVW
uniref:Aspartyl-tRNA synthetase n=1 Tax=Rhodosorus marinus TaxID=101924 RepID=A0A7S2ZI07_9RHOD|mmetsp:Transcript_19698/g.78301  ORF Transcript_19698/g.78301 Transcript_19698/m.78301 type:complete len:360 (+) Transcript_19698:372-1451(+)